MISRIDSHAQAIFELMGFSIALIVIFIVMIIACGVLSIATSWKLGLVGVCAGIPPMVLAGYIRIRTETKMDHDIDSRFSNSASVASESVNAIRTVSSLAIENTVLQRYTAELDHAISGSRRSLFTMMVFFAFTQSVEYFVLGLGFWYVAEWADIHVCADGGPQVGIEATVTRRDLVLPAHRILYGGLLFRTRSWSNVQFCWE